MKLQQPLLLGLFATLLFLSSCDKTETYDDLWKLNNEAQFAEISIDSKYTKLNALSNKGFIMYNEIEQGDGATPVFTDIVEVRYTGWYKYDWEKPDTYEDNKGNVIINKIVFDSTENRNNVPSKFHVNPSGAYGVIDGFSTALQHMQVGDKWEIWIPWKLGYGENGSGNAIPGYTTLVFEIELISIVE